MQYIKKKNTKDVNAHTPITLPHETFEEKNVEKNEEKNIWGKNFFFIH